MAERCGSGSQETGVPPPSSSAEEGNKVTLGDPQSPGQALPESQWPCSRCKEEMEEGCLQSQDCSACLPLIARNNHNPVSQSCKEEENSGNLDAQSLLVAKALSDAAIPKEISGYAVHCGIPGCRWMTLPKNLENLTVVSTREEACRFSRIGCSFKGTTEDRKVHEADATGLHLKLLLKHVKQLKAQLCPTDDGVNTWLTDAKVLTSICFDVMPERPLKPDSLSDLPLYEEETHRQMPLRRAQRVSLLESKLQVFENIASVLSKEMATSRQKFVALRGQRGLDQDMIRGLELKIADLQRCLVQKDAALSKLEERLHSSKQASYDGTFLWKITDVHHKSYEAVCGKMPSFQSPAFYTSRYGYKLCMRIYLNGEGRGKGSHASLFLVLLRGDYDALLQWPFAQKVTLMLLSQNNTEHLVNTLQPDPALPSFQRPVADMNEASGFPKFISLAKLQSPKYAYIKEGTIFLRCITQTCP
ncbi:TNF receptor-associated factor 1 isoform X2 [Sceloporus undulatus]|uniref:TNF receptor-associated factor 1 isoform X2 n=1 Tax=Sceloporus undulatus TaxID=8520 RepID=UPI001C4C19F4|nr:TNF receptor-associated factor 1 isoform X2 [Sceloporus undulatus]